MSGHPTPAAESAVRKPITLPALRAMHANGEPIAMLALYEATMARLADRARIDCLLVGDSLGNVIQGQDSTLPVTVEDIAYHTRAVARGRASAWLIADMPFGSYHGSVDAAIEHAVTLMRAGAQMVKLEGGGFTVPIVCALVERGIPVCAHLGLTPQSVHALGGYRVQGRTEEDASRLIGEATALAEAGAAMLVLELIPSALAARVTAAVPIPTIGIGAGAACSGQVLVAHDALGMTVGKPPRFVRNFLAGADGVEDAFRSYVAAVKSRAFPVEGEHTY
ncbi:MAG: 3-methyl-2-oxobutanoate hydroxymethyltransferase [Casimicrobiaceae bacterium]